MASPANSHYHTRVNILALESSTEACSAAILRADGKVFSCFEIAPRQHTRLLPEMMNSVLASAAVTKSSITHCAFGNGPGAFTGIRIAASQAQGIGIALDIPLIPISSLAILAQVSLDKFDSLSTLVALDARMAEIYWANYVRDGDGLAALRGIESLSDANDIEIPAGISCGAGHGWATEAMKRRQFADFPVDETLLPNAESLLKLANSAVLKNLTCTADHIHINYLRNQVAEKARVKQ
ncbi:MAG: tRNA threonylcarbamoyladenosine biosynthesis protein TsaB [Planctomycetota bacterium]